jgi:hypothetical protein
LNQFIWGVLSALCAVASLFFYSFWRRTRDRLFAGLCAGFGILSAQWAGLGLLNPRSETRHYLYSLRLVAFGFIVWGVIEKNRSSRSS